jgi:hypothetical protein
MKRRYHEAKEEGGVPQTYTSLNVKKRKRPDLASRYYFCVIFVEFENDVDYVFEMYVNVV